MALKENPGKNMKGVLRRRLPVAFIVLLLLFNGSGASDRAPGDGACPADMVWIEKGGFCIDRYEYPDRKGALPAGGLDYQEAIQLCRTRGMRLPTIGEFFIACGGPESDPYPYGAEYAPGVCRDGLKYYEGPAPSGSYPGCENGGVYDMAGNLWEWVEQGAVGRIMGGAWNSSPKGASCKTVLKINPLIIAPLVGVRCVLKPPKGD